MRLRVWVIPNARRSEVADERDDHLRLRLAAAPREDRANEELRRFLAERVGVPRTAVCVTAGRRSRRKSVRIEGATPAQVVSALCR